jgi:3-hydroxybutyryl-CoA dehydrogenase
VTQPSRTLGVVGAGTMGAGIAQLGCAARMRTIMHDPVPEALERGAERARAGLAKWAEKGRAGEDAAGLLTTVGSLEELRGCELVIEAAPERIELKRELFGELSRLCGEDAVLATNTSSIPVTALAAAAERPENVVGMHFFNPPPLMKLLEVIRGDQTGEQALEVARAAGEAMGKRVILAADGPGFLVNRCGRPFAAEALRLVQERIAPPEQVDRICRLGGGYRMGPFELMDLVGIDVGFEVAKSFTELSFGEPRWKPSPLQARMVAAGRLGRKTGRGWYEYSGDRHRPDDPELAEPKVPAAELRERAASEGFVSCAAASLAAQDPGAVGFVVLEGSRLVELTHLGSSPPAGAEDFFRGLGYHVEWVGDAPGLVLGRIVCQLVNEACFAIGESVGSADDVDAGLELGLNHPRGPIAWGELIGFDRVLATIGGLYEERREERYRAAPLLRRAAAVGEVLRD